MSMRFGFALAALAIGLCVAPSSATAQQQAGDSAKKEEVKTTKKVKKQRDVISQEELETSGQKDQDLLSAIRSLRPHFVEPPRGVRTFGNSAIFPQVVYVDGIKQTGMDALLTIMTKDVKEVKYLDPTQSQNEYGYNANGGAIVVKTLTAKGKS